MWNYLVKLLTDALSALHGLTGNYGVAIILLTLAIKLLIYPLTHQQFKSMRDMQSLQPKMKELQDKYKDKPEEMQKRVLALYKEHKINPLGGCLPLIIQMPILFMLYAAILAAKPQFANEGFLWVSNLALPDIPLLLLYAISLFLSSKMTASDPAQAQTQNTMAVMMPLLFTFMAWRYQWPAAFILYWLVFNILSTVQQYFVMRSPGSLSGAKEE